MEVRGYRHAGLGIPSFFGHFPSMLLAEGCGGRANGRDGEGPSRCQGKAGQRGAEGLPQGADSAG